jgi:DNA-binding XRE family transcriptional regulator
MRQWENEEDPAEPILSDANEICIVYGCELSDLFQT